MRSVIRILDADPGDPLAAALARLGRAMQSGKNLMIYRTAFCCDETFPHLFIFNCMT